MVPSDVRRSDLVNKYIKRSIAIFVQRGFSIKNLNSKFIGLNSIRFDQSRFVLQRRVVIKYIRSWSPTCCGYSIPILPSQGRVTTTKFCPNLQCSKIGAHTRIFVYFAKANVLKTQLSREPACYRLRNDFQRFVRRNSLVPVNTCRITKILLFSYLQRKEGHY